MTTTRLTMAQALVRYLAVQHVARDGRENPFFAGMWGIFGHGNVAGIGQAIGTIRPRFPLLPEPQRASAGPGFGGLRQAPQPPGRHSPAPRPSGPAPPTWSRARRWPRSIASRFCCWPAISSPSASRRRFCSNWKASIRQDISVNDCFKPVSRYWDRIYRPEQLITALPEAMRVLTSPVDTGAVTLALPQDVQAEAYDYPSSFFEKRVWQIPRNRPDSAALKTAERVDPRQRAAHHHRRRRHPLQRGLRHTGAIGRANHDPGLRNTSGQGRAHV